MCASYDHTLPPGRAYVVRIERRGGGIHAAFRQQWCITGARHRPAAPHEEEEEEEEDDSAQAWHGHGRAEITGGEPTAYSYRSRSAHRPGASLPTAAVTTTVVHTRESAVGPVAGIARGAV